MSDNDLLLAYRDHITVSSVQQLLSLTELKLAQTGEGKRLRKRVFNILVECLQNVAKHSAEDIGSNDITSILLIGQQAKEFFIVTGNRILNSAIPAFTSRIEEINSWEHANIREIYSTHLGKSKYSEKGGAGLGLIDIYKRSGRKLEYDIQPINKETSFLSLHVTVESEI
jgi:hypothetical protein